MISQWEHHNNYGVPTERSFYHQKYLRLLAMKGSDAIRPEYNCIIPLWVLSLRIETHDERIIH